MCHVVDTANVASRLFDLVLGPRSRDELRNAFSVLGDAVGWIALLCGLHDLGKYSPTFQALHVDLAEQRFGEIAEADLRRVQRQRGLPRLDTPHGLVTALHMKDMLLGWGAESSVAERIAVALGGHHGHFPAGQELVQTRAQVNNHGGARWKAWRDDLVDAVIKARGLPDARTLPWNELRLSTTAAVALAGLTTASDWIASVERNFPSPEDEADFDDYLRSSGARAVKAVDGLDLQPWEPPKDTSFVALFAAAPRPVQAVIERLVQGRTEPTMLVVEAPTGEGKSKGALQAIATLVSGLGLAGGYIGMPTQATSHQVLGEFETMLTHLGDSTAVRLIHSNAKEFLDSKAATPTEVGPDHPEDSDVAAQEWFTRKRSLLSPLGVGTVDQVLKAAIRSGHVFVRLAALSNKVVVIDEVHAYDTYMSTLLDRLLMWLGRMGVSVLLLSATLPSRRREELTAAWRAGMLDCVPGGVSALPSSTAYPRVTMVGSGTSVVESTGVSELNRERSVQLEWVDDDDIVNWALKRAAGGESVAIVHNLVNRATTTSDALRTRIATLPASKRPQLITITGQLADGHRRTVETDLRAAFGPGGSRPKRGAIVVGTQVLEQSLDLDFDAMLTDMAPIDSLIQRAGRVHRHDRDKGRGTLTLAITGVTDTPAGPVFPPYLTNIYQPMVLLRTWALLRRKKKLISPDEVPVLIDAVYGPSEAVECPPGWEQAWQRAHERLNRAHAKDTHDARLMYLPLPVATHRLADMTVRPQNPSKTRKSRYR
ncbi:CRISPR-associated protein Cas3 [Nocardia sp. NRRL S-836]|nr:CRISPR-associated protein Cas3 [Nocardia sp. NRRL S-836]